MTRSLPKNGARERRFIWVGSVFIHKYETVPEKLGRGKHSNSFRPLVSYEDNSFVALAAGYKLIKLFSSLLMLRTPKLDCPSLQAFSALSNISGQV
jgi:hypothetical protein